MFEFKLKTDKLNSAENRFSNAIKHDFQILNNMT